jgi:hypothetical protein
MKSDTEIQKLLSDASRGLLFMSESDYPFEVFVWDNTEDSGITKGEILRLTDGVPADTIEERGLDDFFHTATMDQDWHKEKDKETVAKFRNLVSVLKENLEDIKVFRIGSLYIDVYIAGRAPSGNIAGVSTKQMQT